MSWYAKSGEMCDVVLSSRVRLARNVEKFPMGERLNRAKPVIEYMEGFGDLSACRKKEDLPKAAMDYIQYLEKAVGCPIKYVSVGAERDAYVKMY